jgi:hypothetical protein
MRHKGALSAGAMCEKPSSVAERHGMTVLGFQTLVRIL